MNKAEMEEEWQQDTIIDFEYYEVLDYYFMKQLQFIKEGCTHFIQECEIVLKQYGGW